MKKYILTGTPGSGKTVLIRYLETIGYNVIEEAATDVISLAQACGELRPWTMPNFIEKVVRLQIQRRIRADDSATPFQFFDRSPFCTLALANFLDYPPPQILLDEIDFLKKENVYQPKVFFIENLGHCQQTAARKISLEDASRFEKIHAEVYLAYNFELISISNQSVKDRAQRICAVIE